MSFTHLPVSTTASDMSCVMSDANANSASSFSFHSSNDDQNFPLIWLKCKYLLCRHFLFISERKLKLMPMNPTISRYDFGMKLKQRQSYLQSTYKDKTR